MICIQNPPMLLMSQEVAMAKKKNPHAVKLGRLGGLARAKKLSKEELHKQAVHAGKQGGRPKKVDKNKA